LVDKIIFDEISVEEMDGHSGVFVGVNDANGWNSYSKTQHLVSGDNNSVDDSVFILIDDDVIDTCIVADECFDVKEKEKENTVISHTRKKNRPKKLSCRIPVKRKK
jgi:hypothetical protein